MSHAAPSGPEPKRRDLLSLIAVSGAVIGAGAIAWPLIDSMNPSADVIAAGAPIDIDISKLAAGQQIVVLWRGAPMLIVNRTPEALKTLQEPSLVSRLVGSEFRRASAAALRGKLASFGQAGIRGSGRYLHPSGLPARLHADARRDDPGTRTGRAVTSARAMGRNTIWPVACTRVFRRRTTCRCRRIISSTTRRCASARTRKARRSS